MTEENQTQNAQKNTVATVGMRFSIIWLIALITIFFARLWLPLLFVWFVLGIVGLFYKPKWKAIVAVCIPLVIFIAIISVLCYIWSSVKAPAKEFWNWATAQIEILDEETFDDDRFSNIANEEFNNIFSSMSEEDFKSLLETSTWSNTLEKWSYVLFGLLQQGLENSIEKYNNELPEINDVENQNEDEDEEDNEINNIQTEDVEVFTESEQDDIEQILDLLE